MTKTVKFLIFLAALAAMLGMGLLRAQVSTRTVLWVTSAPTGACSNTAALQYDYVTATLYGCSGSTWNVIGGGGSGGITQLTGNVTAGPGSGSQAATIPANTVTYTMLKQASANTWLTWLGDGSLGAGNCSTAQAPGEYWYSSFTVGLGNTCSTNGVGPLIIRSTGACTIAGTLSSNASNNSGTAEWGGSGGGGGFGAANGVAGGSINYGTITTMRAGGAAGTSGNPGGTGGTTTTAQQNVLISGASMGWIRGGSPGGTGGSSGGVGNNGGGAIILVCGSINFTGTISANGGNGGAGGFNTGGGGGGGGGIIITSTPIYTANTGTLSVTGGNGGAIGTGTSTAGGNGGAGWTRQITIQ